MAPSTTVGIAAGAQAPPFGAQALKLSPSSALATSVHVSSLSHSVPRGQSVAQNSLLPESLAHALPSGQFRAFAHGSHSSTGASGGTSASGVMTAGVPPRSTSVPQATKPAPKSNARTMDAALVSEARRSLRESMASG